VGETKRGKKKKKKRPCVGKKIKNKKQCLLIFTHSSQQERERIKAETAVLIKAEAEHKAAPAKDANVKRRKRFVPTKPTRDEKGILNRLRKHDATKAPAFEKALNDKYSKTSGKKKVAPAKK
jgi:hypothetical protein